MGKLSPADLDRYAFSRTGAPNDDLLVGAGYGEDATAVAIGEGTMVVSTDPTSLAAERIDTLDVATAGNDVAACGDVPEWLVSTVLLPELDVDLLDDITAQLDAEVERLGISIVGGHTEAVAGFSRPLLSLTCMGPTDRYVLMSGAEPGDAVILTKGAGVEGTVVLATGFRTDLDAASVEPAATDRAAGFFDDISVLSESAALVPAATTIHDPTEGGALDGLVEFACTSGVRIEVDGNDVLVRPETRAFCETMGVDPMRILDSGVFLAAVPEGETDDALAALEREGVETTVVGTVEAAGDGAGSNADVDSTTPAAGVIYDGTHCTDGVEDDMCDLWNWGEHEPATRAVGGDPTRLSPTRL